MNLSEAAAALGRKGGSAKTTAKKRTARENGKLGGRPAQKAVEAFNRSIANLSDEEKKRRVNHLFSSAKKSTKKKIDKRLG